MDVVAPSNEAIAVLRAISRAGFAYAQTKKLASEAGWRIIDDELDLGYVQFAMQLDFGKDERRLLSVEISESGRLPRAFVPLFYFEEYEIEREPFDQSYQSLSERLMDVLGSPSRSGEYGSPHREGWQYSYNWWSLSDATFVLVQDELDIQFGMDISLWVLPARVVMELPLSSG